VGPCVVGVAGLAASTVLIEDMDEGATRRLLRHTQHRRLAAKLDVKFRVEVLASSGTTVENVAFGIERGGTRLVREVLHDMQRANNSAGLVGSVCQEMRHN